MRPMLETVASIAVLGLFVAYLGSLPSVPSQQSAATRLAWIGEYDSSEYSDDYGYGGTYYGDSSPYYAEPEGSYYYPTDDYGYGSPYEGGEDYGYGNPHEEDGSNYGYGNPYEEDGANYGYGNPNEISPQDWSTPAWEYDDKYGYGNPKEVPFQDITPPVNEGDGTLYNQDGFLLYEEESNTDGWNRDNKDDQWDLHADEADDTPACAYLGYCGEHDHEPYGYSITEVYEYDRAPQSPWSLNNGYGIPTQYTSSYSGYRAPVPSSGVTYYPVSGGSSGTTYTNTPQTPTSENPSCTIDVSPDEIGGEESATLIWQADNAQAVYTEEGKRIASNGIQVVRPTESKVYQLTVQGAQGKVARCSTGLKVIQQTPQCAITARPSTVTRGDSTLLEWNAKGNVRAAVSGIGDVVKEGSQTVYPDKKTRYELKAIDIKGQTRSCYVDVNVTTSTSEGSLSLAEWLATMDTGKTAEVKDDIPAIATSTNTAKNCQIISNVSSVASGGMAFLQWALPQGYSGVITDIGPVSGVGYKSVTVPSTRTYTLMANGPQGLVNCSTTITVAAQEVAPTCSLSVSKSSVAGSDDQVTLSWSSTNAISAELYKFGSVNTTGTRTVIPTYSRTYTLAVKSKTGEMAACSAAVTVGSGGGSTGGTKTSAATAPTCSISVSPETSPAGGQVTVSWDARNATKATLAPSGGSVAMKSSKTLTPTQSTTYTLSVEDAAGKKSSCSKTVTVSQTTSCANVCGNEYTCVPTSVAQQCTAAAGAAAATPPPTTTSTSNTSGGGFFSKLKFW